jgi:hypothetical protein
MYGTDNVSGIAAALQQQRLPVPANIGQEFNATFVTHQKFGITHPFPHIIVAHIRQHDFMADITRPLVEQKVFFQVENVWVKVPFNRQLSRRQLENINEIGHISLLLDLLRNKKDS